MITEVITPVGSSTHFAQFHYFFRLELTTDNNICNPSTPADVLNSKECAWRRFTHPLTGSSNPSYFFVWTTLCRAVVTIFTKVNWKNFTKVYTRILPMFDFEEERIFFDSSPTFCAKPVSLWCNFVVLRSLFLLRCACLRLSIKPHPGFFCIFLPCPINPFPFNVVGGPLICCVLWK